MILEKLVQHYDTLARSDSSIVAPIGYSSAKVSHEIVLSEDGSIRNINDLRHASEKRLVPLEIIVPLQEKRTAGKKAYFLCDKSKYVFGLELNKSGNKKSADDHESEDVKIDPYPEYFHEFKKWHEELFAEVDDAEARAMLAFLRWWESRRTDPYPEIKQWMEHIAAASNFVFRLSGKPAYIHENPVIIGVWEKCFSRGVSDYSAQCLITGEIVPIAKVHQSIKGVAGAKSTGSAIVSFNIPSFLSYGKEQSYNAPIGQTAMLKYTTALNYLLSGENKIRIGDTTIVYWAEQISPKEEIFLQFMLNPRMTHAETESEPSIMSEDDLVQEIGGVLEAVRDGRRAADPLEKLGLDPNLTFNILGLAPNASRLSIRFWFVDHFGSLIEKIAEHYADMDIERPPKAFKYVPTWALLKEMAAPGKEQKVPNSLISSLNYAILNGTGYPYAMLSAMLGRIRADKSINYQRAGFIKAFLIRRDNKKEVFTVSLNLENKTPAYLLGRLFSLLEKAQIEAHNEKLNRTIRDRYFGAASATPAIVFPQLLRLVQHHISKSNYGGAIDKKIQAVLDDLPAFPKHLSLEEQGSFFLGYYQQKQDNYGGKNNS